MEQEVVISRKNDVKSCVEELCSKLNHNSSYYKAVFFMAAIDYDFEELSECIKEKFAECEVIGTTTAGEISPDGFLKNSVVLTTMASPKVKCSAVLVENGKMINNIIG